MMIVKNEMTVYTAKLSRRRISCSEGPKNVVLPGIERIIRIETGSHMIVILNHGMNILSRKRNVTREKNNTGTEYNNKSDNEK